MSTNDNFDALFSELLSFSPEIDDADIFVPSSSSSSSSPSAPPHHSSSSSSKRPIRFLSQNVNRSNVTTHALLNSSSLSSSTFDIVLIQEPWFGFIGTNTSTGSDIRGTVAHRDWVCLIPPSPPDSNPDVLFYVRKHHPGFFASLRSDLSVFPCCGVLELSYENGPSAFIINIYNPSDSSALPTIRDLSFPSLCPVMVAGDFNLHHDLWSKDSSLNKTSPEADLFVEMMVLKGYSLMNIKGIETFFRSSSYTSVLDLLWVSPTASPDISSFRVAHDLHCGSDHYALAWKWSFPDPSSSSPSASFNFHDDKSEDWMERFSDLIGERWTFNDVLETPDIFLKAATVFTECMSQASLDTSARKPPSPKTARWFNQEVRESLRVMRADRRRARFHASRHNLLRYQTSNAQFRYKVKRAKRSYALAFASRVTHKNLWRLNSWYRGVRRTYSPSLVRPDGSPTSDTSEKCQLLLDAWFPPPAPIPGSFRCDFSSPLPSTRPFPSVTHLEISDALRGTSSTSAPGHSGLNYKVLKWAFIVAPDELASIVRASIHLGVHHPLWKKAVIVSIPKANKKSYALPRSHRPIQLLECLGKLVEKVVAKRLLFDAGKHRLMPFTQFGGRSHASCLDAGLALTHDIESARSAGLVSSFLALDIKGFFDHVNHARLVHTLWEMGFPRQICSWVLSFLSDRSASVHLDDYSSPFALINVGVPQGSPVSPVLACLYAAPVIRQLTDNPILSSVNLPTSPRSYVDDLAFLAISDSLAENCIILGATLQRAETCQGHSTLLSVTCQCRPTAC